MTHEEWVEGLAKHIYELSPIYRIIVPHQRVEWVEVKTTLTAESFREQARSILAFVLANLFDPTEQMLEAGRKAWKKPRLHVSHAGSDEFMTCGVIHRAMIEASGLKP